MLLSEHLVVSKHELATSWSYTDLYEAHEALDAYEAQLRKAQAAKGRA